MALAATAGLLLGLAFWRTLDSQISVPEIEAFLHSFEGKT